MIRIFGIEVDRKTDILALAAFLISLVGILSQVQAFVQGPNVQLFGPEQIMLVTSKYGNKAKFMRVAARMAYVNRGARGYYDIVKREGVSFHLGRNKYSQFWQAFLGPDRKKGIPDLDAGSCVLPTRVGTDMPAAHITYFAPWPECYGLNMDNHNYLTTEQFLTALPDEKLIRFEFWAEMFSGKRRTAVCTVSADEVRAAWTKNRGFAAPVCRELSTG
jgi:hypothetical protein